MNEVSDDAQDRATQDGAGLTDGQRRRAALRLRRWLGAEPMDALLGAQGADDAGTRLLANHPVVTSESVQDGLDLLAARRNDHPGGLRVERLGTVLTRARVVAWTLFVVAAILLVAAAIILSDTGDSDLIFEELADRLGGSGAVLVVPLLILFAVAVVLVWVTASWRHVIALGEARHAVRWAAGRPGQMTRGLPVVEPFNGFRGWLIGPAVICWSVAALTLAVVLWMAADGEIAVVPLLVGVGLGLVGWLFFAAQRALARTARIANDHLVLLRPREHSLRMTPATALRERFLILKEGAFETTASEERTVYPFTVQLPADELKRLHEQNDQDLEPERTMIGAPDEAPLVTAEKPGDESTLEGYFEREYAGGWLVAQARTGDGAWGRNRRAWIIVRDHPERFSQEVLPQFGDRHGLVPRSLRLLDEPQQVWTEGAWIESWVKRQRVSDEQAEF